MIDVKKEIRRYMPVNMDNILYEPHGAIKEAVQGFHKILKRVDKGQYRYSHQLEEILEILDDLEKDKNAINALQKKDRESEKEIDRLLNAILELADSLEDIYSYAIRFGHKALQEQMSIEWKRIGDILNQYGIHRLEGIGTLFTSSLYVAKAVEENQDIPHAEILEILRSGYMYKDRILRKAEVVVNRREE